MDTEYVIKVICVEPDGQQNSPADFWEEYYVGRHIEADIAYLAPNLDFAYFFGMEILDAKTGFEFFVDKFHSVFEEEAKKKGLTVDGFELCRVDLTTVAKVVV